MSSRRIPARRTLGWLAGAAVAGVSASAVAIPAIAAGTSAPFRADAAVTATSLTAATGAVLAADPVVAPNADVVSIDFDGGAANERAQSKSVTTWGNPTYSYDSEIEADVMSVDGVDDAVSVDLTPDWASLTSGFTFECVFRIDDTLPTSSERDLCSDKEAGGASIYVTGSNLGTMAHIGGGYKSALTPIDANRWYHVLSVWDGATLKLYVNGELAASTAASGSLQLPAASARRLVVGGDAAPSGTGQMAPVSRFAAASVHSRAVTSAEAQAMAALYATTASAPAADVLDVDFDDSTPADDAQGLDYTVWGAPTITDEPALGRDVAAFDGTADAYSYEFGNEWSKINNAVSVECVFRMTGSLPNSQEQDLCSSKEGGGYSMVVYGDALTFTAHVGGGYKSASIPIVSGRWYHAVGTWDGSNVKLYVDGQLVATKAATGSLTLPSGSAKNAFYVGADSVNQFYAPAVIAAARVYSHAASTVEVVAMEQAQMGEVRDAGVELVSSTPADGGTLTKPRSFELDVRHQGSALGWTYTLDGEPIQLGQKIGAGLAKGTHTIKIAATDVFGEEIDWEVNFTSPAIPTGGGVQTDQGNAVVSLSAIASSPDGSDVTTTFKSAEVEVADGGFQGVVTSVPGTLDFAYAEGSTLTGELVADHENAVSVSTGQIPFQRFDLDVPGTADEHRVNWSGLVDPERSVSLRVWNTQTNVWQEVAQARGSADSDTALSAQIGADHVENGTIHVLVLGEDPFSDDLAPRDSSAQDNKDQFASSDEYDFSLVHFTDTQYLSEGAAGGTYNDFDGIDEASDVMAEEERLVWEKSYRASTQWIADNAQARKIAYTAHTGDVIENDYYNPLSTNSDGSLRWPGLNEQVDAELAASSSAQSVLDEAGLVNQVIAGNHDNQLGTETGPDSRFSTTFSADRYYDASQSWPEGASFHTWDEETNEAGETTTKGRDSQNNYVLFSAGGLDFVAVGLSYGVTQEEADWASSVFERYPDRNGILITHAYLAPSSAADGRGAAFSTDGSRLYKEVVADNPNVFLILAGHEHGVGTNIKTDIGAEVSHNVVELLADYQFYTVTAGELFSEYADASGNIDFDNDGVKEHSASDRLQFGSSFLRLLQFDVDRSEMIVDTYSPLLDNFGATEYDTKNRYNGAEDNMVLPVDLSSRTTSFATDEVAVVTPGETVIGEATARSGWPATVTWAGLQEGERYAWTATSWTQDGDLVGSSDQFGGTFVATAAGSDSIAPTLQVPARTEVDFGAEFDPMDQVSATDNVDGNLNSQVQVVGSVDTTVAGDYALTYLVADANGNQAIANRVVTVRAEQVEPKTSTTVSGANATVAFDADLTLTATITPVAAGGTVQFLSGEDVLCEAEVAGGAAQCAVSMMPPPGRYPVNVLYSGDATHAASEDWIVLTVDDAAAAMRAEDTAMVYGKKAKLSVQVPGASSGTVTVSRAGSVIASGRVLDGVASVRLPARSLGVGTHTLEVNFTGAGGGATQATVKVTKAKSKVRATAVAGRNNTAVVQVAVTARGVVPSGPVRVRIAGRTFKARVVGGVASVKVTGLRPGHKVATAIFGGGKTVTKARTTVRFTVAR